MCYDIKTRLPLYLKTKKTRKNLNLQTWNSEQKVLKTWKTLEFLTTFTC